MTGGSTGPVKVALSGAFSTGKSTLIQAAADRLRSEGIEAAVLEDVARTAPLSLHKDQTPAASAWLLGTQIARESEALDSDPDLVLCDRAIFDVLSHTLLIEPRSDRDRQLMSRIWEIGAAWAGTYDLVITTGVNHAISPAPDGLRVADDKYRDQLDASLSTVFERLGLTRRDLPTTPHQALEGALAQLRELL